MADKLGHASGGAVVDTVGTNSERERSIARLAFDQHGVVALSQLIGLGFGVQAVERRVRDGRLLKIHREVFAVGHRRLSQRSYWWAAVLAYGDQALLSHRSAAAFWELAKPRSSPIDVTAPVGWQGLRRREGIWIHRGKLHPEDRAERAGIPVTSIARSHAVRLRRSRRLRAAGASLGGGRPAQAAAAGRGRTGRRARLRPARLETDQAPARRSPRRHPDPLPRSRIASRTSPASTSCRRTAPTSTSSAKRSTCSGPPPS